jgi:hypothetical protein
LAVWHRTLKICEAQQWVAGDLVFGEESSQVFIWSGSEFQFSKFNSVQPPKRLNPERWAAKCFPEKELILESLLVERNEFTFLISSYKVLISNFRGYHRASIDYCPKSKQLPYDTMMTEKRANRDAKNIPCFHAISCVGLQFGEGCPNTCSNRFARDSDS